MDGWRWWVRELVEVVRAWLDREGRLIGLLWAWWEVMRGRVAVG